MMVSPIYVLTSIIYVPVPIFFPINLQISKLFYFLSSTLGSREFSFLV